MPLLHCLPPARYRWPRLDCLSFVECVFGFGMSWGLFSVVCWNLGGAAGEWRISVPLVLGCVIG